MHEIFDPKLYTQRQSDSYIAGIPFDCIYPETSNIKVVVDSGKFFSQIYDTASFESAQESFLKNQTEALKTNPSVSSLLQSKFGSKVMATPTLLEADPSLYHDLDDLRSVTFTEVEQKGKLYYFR